MVDVGSKVRYVLRQGQTRYHECHWPGCDKQVAPAKWGCKEHWFRLPPMLRAKIWRTYKIGQERKGRPSAEYVHVAREVQDWIKKHGHEAKPAPKRKRVGPVLWDEV